jgi:glycerol-3-phosphate acyltransferase PlsY
MLALDPVAALVAVVAFVLVVGLTRYVSLGSMTAVTLAVITLGLRGGSWGQIIITGLGAGAIIWRHQPNIRRLLAGQENKFSFRGRTGAAAPAPTRPVG